MSSKILQKLRRTWTKTNSRIKIFVKPHSISKSAKGVASVGVWIWQLSLTAGLKREG